jgi:hypothetical protein
MATLVAVLMLVTPFAALAAAMALVERRHGRRHAEIRRQIALTDALHARLGAVVAPFVRRRGGAWQVAVAVPFERPSVVAEVLEAAERHFANARYEVVLSQQTATGSRPAEARPALRESLSWT